MLTYVVWFNPDNRPIKSILLLSAFTDEKSESDKGVATYFLTTVGVKI